MADNQRRIGVILNGVTGRMGTNQHLLRSIVPILRQGGVRLADGTSVVPVPVLVGRNPDKLKALSERSGVAAWTTDVEAALADPANEIYFDAQTTDRRFDAVARAIAAGKHIYCEKPTATKLTDAVRLHELATAAGVKNGVVQDKLWLPGVAKLRVLRDRGFFGRVLAVKGDFGYWVFEGDRAEPQRPSWNYRAEDGGGIIYDMFCHWRYVLDHVIAPVRRVLAHGARHIPQRWDENGQPYDCTAEDAAYALFEMAGGVVAQFNSSWCTRVRRDDLLTIQVDGAEGSAVAGLREVRTQSHAQTPRAVWNPDEPQPIDFYADWQVFEDEGEYENAFKAQWELFLRHVAAEEPFPWTLLEGAKGVQLAEAGMTSWRQRRWVELEELAGQR